MDFDVLAFIGRFQPFHNGHKAVVDEALTRARKVALVIGSHDQPRNTRNPFTTAERIEMITAVYPDEVREGRIAFVPMIDHRYNDRRWMAGVHAGVTAVAHSTFTADPIRIGLIGHSKDSTSFYLSCFPTWKSIEVPNVAGINATALRDEFFGGVFMSFDVPDAVSAWLDSFSTSSSFRLVQDEHSFVLRYREQWASAPYAPTFHTVDAVVVQSEHILLVERGAMPGKGLWALPGGFLNADEWIEDGVLRELREETTIALSEETLRRCITKQRVFDDPNRSQRGRTITTAFLIELRPDVKLTKVKGADDAAKAKWVPLSKVTRGVMFEDHYDIITEMTGAI